MFNPSQQEVRQFFCETFRKTHEKLPLTPLESIASDWLLDHPEYETILADNQRAQEQDYSGDQGRENPFLHLSMHLSIAEQVSIDQPPGIRDAAHLLTQRLQSQHAAHHIIMECLGEMLWTAQRYNRPPDGAAYIEAIRKHL